MMGAKPNESSANNKVINMSNNEMKLSPVGRIVQGDIWELSTKGYQGAEQSPQIFIALAIPKNDPATIEFMNNLYGVAAQGFPQMFAQGAPHPATFAYKYHDGDDPVHAAKPGFAGHYVLKLTTGFEVRVVKRNPATQKLEDVMDHSHCKRGDYIQCQYSVVSNENREKPGVYLNLGRLAQHVAYGEAIMGGANPDDVFTEQQAPVGSSVNPTAGAMPQGQQPQQGFQPQQQAAPQQGFQPQQQAAPQQGFQPQQQGQQPQAAPQQGFQPQQAAPQQGFQPQQQGQQPQAAPQQGFQPQAAPQQQHQQQGFQPQAAPQQGFQPQQQPLDANGSPVAPNYTYMT
jgi:hypothetical protein